MEQAMAHAYDVAVEKLSRAHATTYAWIAVVLFAIFALRNLTYTRGVKIPEAPIVGAKWWWEPLFITKYRYTTNAWQIIHDGYTKYKDSPFTIVRPESIVTVLPKKYVHELRNVPESKLYAFQALADDLVGRYSGIDIMLGSDLNFHAVQNKLTPRIGAFTAIVQDELDFAMQQDFPKCNGICPPPQYYNRTNPPPSPGKPVLADFNTIILRIVSRITLRTFVGLPLCRNEELLRLNCQIVEHIFTTMVIMRLFPLFLHPVIARLLPPYWHIQRIKARIVAIVAPMIRHRQSSAEKSDHKPPEDVLQWYIDLAKPEEAHPDNIATRYIYAVLGSLFSVSGAVKDTLYEMCARPECVAPLREEISAALQEDGGWKKSTPGKLVKLDGFMREVQRVNPPSALGFKRVVLAPSGLTLSSGLHLPKTTYICVPTTSHLDPDFPCPATFDPSRYLPPSSSITTHHQGFTTTSPSHLHFGHGRHACPGRFFAAAEIKAVVARVVMGWELAFPPQQGRPRGKTILEIAYQDPGARVVLRERGTLQPYPKTHPPGFGVVIDLAMREPVHHGKSTPPRCMSERSRPGKPCHPGPGRGTDPSEEVLRAGTASVLNASGTEPDRLGSCLSPRTRAVMMHQLETQSVSPLPVAVSWTPKTRIFVHRVQALYAMATAARGDNDVFCEDLAEVEFSMEYGALSFRRWIYSSEWLCKE
ncbi:MAG: hypothetical protein Q9173_001833 [Seirophora scorigena]